MRAAEKRLRERIQALESQLEEIKQDREMFRDHFATRFRWWIKLLGEQSKPNLAWVIEDDAKYLRRMQWWGW